MCEEPLEGVAMFLEEVMLLGDEGEVYRTTDMYGPWSGQVLVLGSLIPNRSRIPNRPRIGSFISAPNS